MCYIFSVCVCIISFVNQSTKRVRRIVLLSVACLALPFFFPHTISYRARFSEKKNTEHTVCVLTFSTICGNKMPTKCNRDFYCRSDCLLNMFRASLCPSVEGYVSDLQDAMSIIRTSRVLYSGCCLWYFVLWFSSCWSGAELRVMCPVCRMLQHPANRTHNPQLMGIVMPETC